MKVLLRPNFEKEGSIEATYQTIRALLRFGITPMLDGADDIALDQREDGCVVGSFRDLLPDCDLVLTIGGDGTILHAVQEIIGKGKPLLGINTGRIGFLTQLEISELDHLRLLSEGKFTTLNRMLLEATLVQRGRRERYFALNDAVLSRHEDHLVEIEISCDTGYVATHRADGVIFCTPTGSTAYSLSAGGAIAHPSLKVIQMTAICPHSHFNRSLILSPEQQYQVREVAGHNQGGLVVTVDGMRAGILRQGDELLIQKSDESIPFVDLGIRDFYNCVHLKLSYRR